MRLKAVKDQIYHFIWNPPAPYAPTPSITVKLSGGDYTANFTQSRTDATVTTIANDRRTLTLSAPVASALERDEIKAFLKTDRDTFYAVTVSRLGGSSAVLAEPLPREIDLTSSATLNFTMSTLDIPAANLDTSGMYPYTISFTDTAGASHVETGLLKVTPRPFNTGLSHDELVAQMANLADMVPRRQSDFTPQIRAALDELALMIRDHVVTDGVSEDEVFNQQSFLRAHVYCSAAMIFEMNNQFDAAAAMRERFLELLEVALRSVTLDLNSDGVIDTNEENLRRAGGSSADFSASWSSFVKSSNDSLFTPSRGQRH